MLITQKPPTIACQSAHTLSCSFLPGILTLDLIPFGTSGWCFCWKKTLGNHVVV